MMVKQEKSKNELLILFTRFPAAGQVKTRLIPALGPYKAAKLQKILTVETIRQAETLARRRETEIEIFFCGGDREKMREIYKTSLTFQKQMGKSLGDRLDGAFRESFHRRMDKVVVVGTDCPFLDARVMEEALVSLENSDVVAGPASDGGFYLIGMRAPQKDIFSGIAWGTETALTQLVDNVREKSLSLSVTRQLTDIDIPADLCSLPSWMEGSLS